MKGQLAGAAVEEEEELPPPSSLTFSTCETRNFQWLMGTCQTFAGKSDKSNLSAVHSSKALTHESEVEENLGPGIPDLQGNWLQPPG